MLLSMIPRRCAAFTWVEMVVSISIICVLAALAWPALEQNGCRYPHTLQTLTQMRELQLETQTMALDGMTTGATNLGWPADTGSTFDRWAYLLVASNYLTTNELCKLLSTPGKQVSTNRMPRKEDAAVLLYAVGETNDGSVVFLTTANFTNTPQGGPPPALESIPFGTNGFVVFHKGGDGSIRSASHAGQTNLVGAYAPLCR